MTTLLKNGTVLDYASNTNNEKGERKCKMR